MTESTVAPATAPADKASFWEDLIDIFVHPAAVFERRRNASAWPPLLFVVIAIAVISFATFNSIQPAFEGDMRRTLPKMMAQNPQMTQEMADKMLGVQATIVRYVAGLAIAVSIVIVGLLTWLLGKMFGAVENFGAAVLIASYAYMPRVLGTIANAVQGLLMDPAKLTSVSSLSLGPARFFDPDTTSPMTMALLNRFDLMVLWETALLAIGLSVIGKISGSKAAAFGALIWLVGGLYLFRTAYMMS